MKKLLSGPYAVLLTPFKGREADKEKYRKQVARLYGSKISGYLVNGSTAEFIHLSLKEQMELTEICKEEMDPDKQLIVSACTGNASDTYELCKHAGSVGAAGVLVCPPYYFTNSEKDLENYYLRVAEASPVPVFLYNIPFFTQELPLSVIYRLFEHGNIKGIKDSSANMKRLIHMVSRTRDTDIAVLTGTDDILVPAISAGCDGSMTALACIMPDTITDIYDELRSGNIEKALKIQYSILEDTRKADALRFPRGYKDLMEKVSGMSFPDKEIVE